MSKDERPVKVNIPPHMLGPEWKTLKEPQPQEEEKEKQNEDDNSEKQD